MAELNTDGPKGWTPAVEKSPEQQKLRAKVDENIAEGTAYRKFSAPKRLADAKEGLTSLTEEVGQTIHNDATEASRLLAQAALAEVVASMPNIKEVGRDYLRDTNRIAREAGRKSPVSDPTESGQRFGEVLKNQGDEYRRQGIKKIEESVRKVADLKTQVDMAQRRVKKLEPDEQYHGDQFWQMKRRGRTPQVLENRRQARVEKKLRVGYGKADKRI